MPTAGYAYALQAFIGFGSRFTQPKINRFYAVNAKIAAQLPIPYK
ncbi:hypothetical protein [Nostoc sp.]